MPTELDLRPGRAEDAADLARVHLTARRAAPMPAPVHTDDEVRRWLATGLADDEVWVAVLRRRVVGYTRCTDTWLDDLYVEPDHAGRGVGSALLDVVKAQRPAGFSLWVFETNTPARAFYARRGLVELERTDGSGNEERAPDVRTVWPGHDPEGFLRALLAQADVEIAEARARREALSRALREVGSAGPR